MKITVSRRYILLMAFILVLAVIYSGGLAMASSSQLVQEQSVSDSLLYRKKAGPRLLERPMVHESVVGASKIDFSLTATGRSQFELSFQNPHQHPVKVKIYNIIGNVLASEVAPAGRPFVKTYNFKAEKMRLFVVEVGNEKHNLTKKVTTI